MKKLFLLIFLILVPLQTVTAEDYDFEDEEGFFDEEPKEVIADPLKFINKPIFKFNDFVFSRGVKPVIKVYEKVVPELARNSIKNFFVNLQSPIRVVNHTLQGNLKETGKEIGRFAINSTIGIGGLFDPATSEFKLKMKNEDFGQTFGKWGIGPGIYVQLPFFAPTNTRDFVGAFLNTPFSLSSYFFPHNKEYYYGMRGIEIFNRMVEVVPMVDMMQKNALDPYTFTRDGWSQYREKLVRE